MFFFLQSPLVSFNSNVSRLTPSIHTRHRKISSKKKKKQKREWIERKWAKNFYGKIHTVQHIIFQNAFTPYSSQSDVYFMLVPCFKTSEKRRENNFFLLSTLIHVLIVVLARTFVCAFHVGYTELFFVCTVEKKKKSLHGLEFRVWRKVFIFVGENWK